MPSKGSKLIGLKLILYLVWIALYYSVQDKGEITESYFYQTLSKNMYFITTCLFSNFDFYKLSLT